MNYGSPLIKFKLFEKFKKIYIKKKLLGFDWLCSKNNTIYPNCFEVVLIDVYHYSLNKDSIFYIACIVHLIK